MFYGLVRPFFNTIKMVKDTISPNLPGKLISSVCPSPLHNYKNGNFVNLIGCHHSSIMKSTIHTEYVFKDDFQVAVQTLNSLQTNIALLESYKKMGKRSHSNQESNLWYTKKYLERTGVSLEQLDGLSVIHVSGTKGKGSTCAFCESILRHSGFKTGFFSSPHLVAVRERIRIDGKPLSEEAFTNYFWHVYNALYEMKENDQDMPSYFKFLTVMAFNVFLIEKVDVAIIEVGIGGEYDCTNVLRNVPVVGITSLGMDHMTLLGDSIEEIAWQKGGILKKGAAAYSVEQLPNAWDVLARKASERECSLQIVPSLEEYNWEQVGVKIPKAKKVQAINASLALQLARAWLDRQNGGSNLDKYVYEEKFNHNRKSCKAAPFTISPSMLTGLCKTSWPGRMQVLNRGLVTFFLDGAHTSESICACIEWFLSQEKPSRDLRTVLLFNITGSRDALNLLEPLSKCKFDEAIFCPNVVERFVESSSDQANFMVSDEKQQDSSKKNYMLWQKLHEVSSSNGKARNEKDNFEDICTEIKSHFFPCVIDAISFIEKETLKQNVRTQVLVTGSLHLIGCVLNVLDPNLTIPSEHFSVEISVDKS